MALHISEKKTFQADKEHPFFDWIPRTGPNGFRNVLSRLLVVADLQVDVATAALEGEDVARVFGRIKLEESDGRFRWNLTGDESRIASYAFAGADRVTELADIAAASANAQRMYALEIPLIKRYARNPYDFALPVDEFKQMLIQCPSSSGLSVGSSAVTIDSVDYYVIAETYEEHDFQFHAKDYVSADQFQSTSEQVFTVDGKLHDLILHKRGAAGGTTLTGVTDLRIDEPTLLTTMKRTELKYLYRWKRNAAANDNGTIGSELRSDPFVNDKAVAVLLHDANTSAWDERYTRRMKVSATNSESNLMALKRVIRHQNPDQRAAMMALYGINPGSLVVKTEGKTRRQLAQWPEELRPYLPLKAPMGRRAA